MGTNTFHLLIVEMNEDKTFKELFRKRIFVQLAEEGIGKIGEEPLQRAHNAMLYFQGKLEEHQVTTVKALGTAALRAASNGREFIQHVAKQTGISIELISGNEEARLICEGARLAVPITEEPVLIMDIGGGSVEFIIANNETQFWAKSFPLGVAVLFKNFHKTDPIAEKETTAINRYLHMALEPLRTALEKHPVKQLVGSSGTFDVLDTMLAAEKPSPNFSSFPADKFQPVYDRLIGTTLEERLADADVPDQRAKLMIVALILIRFVLEQSAVDSIWVSAYAMKEGVVADLQQVSG